MSITPRTPSLNPPPPGDDRRLADTPNSDNYDVLIDGVGYMLFRAQDDSLPSRYYSINPNTRSYSPTFIPRTNVNGDYGDAQQDFYMTWSQRDWSGGEGQKFYRQAQDRDRSYWDGNSVRPTEDPGQVVLGPREATLSMISSASAAVNVVYVKETKDGTLGDGVVRVEALSSATLRTYYSVDGGDNWTAMCATSAPTLDDVAGLVCGDNSNIYLLCAEYGASTTSKIYYCSGLGATSWTAIATPSTTIKGIEWFNGGLYTINDLAVLKLFSTSDGSQITIKDLGGGQIVSMKAAAGYLWLLYASAVGDYRLIQYDGSAFTEVAVLPKGWRLPQTSESYSVGHARTTHSMVFQDGVMYVAGMLPTNNALISGSSAWTYRSALWFYAGGNSGLIWQGNSVSQAFDHGGGAIAAVDGGMIVFTDHLDFRLMAYDPRTGGVFTLSTINSKPSGSSLPPIVRLEYDQENHVLFGVWLKDYDIASDTHYTVTANKVSRWRLRKSPQNAGGAYITTSQFDFDSSLPKYFKAISVDGDLSPLDADDAHASSFDIYYQVDGTDPAGFTLLQSGATPGTFYDLAVTGHAIQVKVVLNLNASATFGPALTRVSVRAVPLQPTYRQVDYILAIFDEMPLADGSRESASPAQVRKALETSITSQVPITVSDSAMTGVTMVFLPEKCEIKEVRENEYLAFVSLREV